MTERTAFRGRFLALVFALGMPGMALVAAAPPRLYVAPSGNDHWSGKVAVPNRAGTDGPLRTLEQARDRLRRYRSAPGVAAGAEVVLRDGVYALQRPLVLTPEDSGSASAPVIFRAYPGERPVISGGKRIVGWHEVEAGVWEAPVPKIGGKPWRFRQLFVNGKRRTPARTPNAGEFFHYEKLLEPLGDRRSARGNPRKKMGFVYREGDVRRWPDWRQARIVYFHSWTASLHWIEKIDEKNRTLRFTAPAGWPIGWWGKGERYFVEGIRAALDQPGEWYLDETREKVLYRPLPGEHLGEVRVVAPVVRQWLQLQGEPELGLWVEHIQFRGLTFHYADWDLPRDQAHDGQAAEKASAAILARGARSCVFEDCELAHTGAYALGLRRGCRHWRLRRNHLLDLGGGGIRIGEPSLPQGEEVRVGGHEVDNNFIHDYGAVYRAGVGIFVLQSSNNRITHNEIRDGWYSGISVGWNWGTTPTDAHENEIAWNHIHHVLRNMLSDGAGIYMLGESPGTVIHHNLIHDVFAYASPPLAWGIYLDALSSRILVENNLCYHTMSGGLMMHNGSFAHVIRNNIFAKSAYEQVWRALPRGGPSRFERNICTIDQGEFFHFDPEPDTTSFWDYNLYWRTDGKEAFFNGETFQDWRDMGFDRHSLVADPKFVNAAANDFRLRPDSPALTQLGFKAFDLSTCGLYGDPAWTNLPKARKFPPTVLPPAPEPRGPLELDEGFEDSAVGDPPRGAVVSLGNGAGNAAIAVVADGAMQGRHCLLVRDAEGLEKDYNPHFYYRPGYRRGRMEFQCCIKVKKGAKPWIECRDGPYPYAVGPSLKIDAEGRLLANGKPIMRIPFDTWVKIRLRCPLGRDATGRYELSVTLPGKPTKHFPDLHGDKRFHRLTWLGFVSLATTETEFFLDDIKLSNPRP